MAFDPYHKWLGIPTEDQPPDHYRLLSLARFESDPDVIEGAADRQMAHVRTFQTGQHSAASQKLLNELAAARLCLLTPDKKSAYDGELRRRIDAAQRVQPAVRIAKPLHVAPVVPLPAAPAATATPAPVVIVTDDAVRPRATHKRRSALSRSAPAWAALAAVAIPAFAFIGYLIYTKPQPEPARKVTAAPRPEEPRVPAKKDAETQPHAQAEKSPEPSPRGKLGPAPVRPPEVAQAERTSDGFLPLFNGRDLTGWKPHPSRQGLWRVEDGVLIGSGPASSNLFSERGNYTNFHLRVEASINEGGNSGVFGRSAFDAALSISGYEAQINSTHADKNKTGSLYGPGTALVTVLNSPTPPDQWFTLEIITSDNHITVKINGQTTADYIDPDRRFVMGHIALQQLDPQTIVKFRKIEIRELESEIADNGPRVTPAHIESAGFVMQRFPCDILGATSGDWSIEGNELVRRADLPESTILFGDPSWTDYDFRFDAKVVKGWHVRIFFRHQDEANFHSYGIGAWDNIRELVDTMESGKWGNRQFERPRSLATNTWYRIQIEVRGKKGRCFLNGESAGEFTMPHLLNGRVGFVVERKASYQFRNIVVKSQDGKVLLEGLPDLRAASVAVATSKEVPAPPAAPPAPRQSLADLSSGSQAPKLTAQEAFSLKQHTGAVTRVAFHRGMPVLASAGKDGQVLLWNLQSRAFQLQLHKFREEVWAVKFSPDGTNVAYANRHWWGSRLFFKTLVGQQLNEVKDFKDGGGAVASIAYSPDGRLFAAGQDDGTIRLWDIAQFTEITPVGLGEGHNVYGLVFGRVNVDRKSKRSEYLLAEGGEDGLVRTFSATLAAKNGAQWTLQQTNVQFPKAGRVIGLRFSADGNLLGYTRGGGHVSLCDPRSGETVRDLSGGSRGSGSVEWIAFHPQRPWCVTAHKNDQVARIWDTKTAELLCELRGHTGGVMCAEFSPDGRQLATASEDLSVKIWNLAGPGVPAVATRGKKPKFAPMLVGD